MNKIAGDARVQHEACSKSKEIGVGIHGGGQVMVVEEEEEKEKSSLKSLLSAVKRRPKSAATTNEAQTPTHNDFQVIWKIEHVHSQKIENKKL